MKVERGSILRRRRRLVATRGAKGRERERAVARESFGPRECDCHLEMVVEEEVVLRRPIHFAAVGRRRTEIDAQTSGLSDHEGREEHGERVDDVEDRPDQREKDGDCPGYDEYVGSDQGSYTRGTLEFRNTVKSVPYGVRDKTPRARSSEIGDIEDIAKARTYTKGHSALLSTPVSWSIVT